MKYFYSIFLLFSFTKSINAQTKSLWSKPLNIEISNRIAIQKSCESEDKKPSTACVTEAGWSRISSSVQQQLTNNCIPGYTLQNSTCVSSYNSKKCKEFEFVSSSGCVAMSNDEKNIYTQFLNVLKTSKLSPDSSKDAYAKAEHTLNRFGYGPRTGFLSAEVLASLGVQEIAKYITLQFKLMNNQSTTVEQHISKLFPAVYPVPGKNEINTKAAISNFIDALVNQMIADNEIEDAISKKLDKTIIDQLKKTKGALDSRVRYVRNENFTGARHRKILNSVFNENQFGEVLEEFWLNHFNVFFNTDFTGTPLQTYIESTKNRIYSNFYDLLYSTVTSSSMSFYLHNAWNYCNVGSKDNCTPYINEDYGRELMELHTLNWPANDDGTSVYNQAGVNIAARILSGWWSSVSQFSNLFVKQTLKAQGNSSNNSSAFINDYKASVLSFSFIQNKHDNRPLKEPLVLSNPYKDSSEPAVNVFLDATEKSGLNLLKELSMHIATRRGICTKLMVKFVNDDAKSLSLLDVKDPSSLRGMLLACDKAWKDSNGDLKKVYLSIFTHPDFWSQKAYNQKIKTPFESLISSIRLSGVSIDNVTFANTNVNTGLSLLNYLVYLLKDSGMPLYECAPPTGYSDRGSDWISVKRIVNLYNTSSLTTSFYKNLTFENYAKDNVASGKPLSVYNLLKEVFDLRFIANTTSQNYIDNIIVNSPNTSAGNPQLLQTFLSHALGSQEFLIK